MAPVDPTELDSASAAPLRAFVATNDTYSLSEKVAGSSIVDLCRGGKPGQRDECIVVREALTSVFAEMQRNGFICLLPMDPSRVNCFDCTRIEKLPENK